MKNLLIIMLLSCLFGSCNHDQEISSINPENWSKRAINIDDKDSLEYGKSYLSIYSQVYSMSEHRKRNMTCMVSLRNISDKDTIYLLKAEYLDTHGELVRKYFDFPIFLAPMETTEIIIDEIDDSGGTGSNFIFEWKIPKGSQLPLFEGVMTSTMGQQGLSIITNAIRIE